MLSLIVLKLCGHLSMLCHYYCNYLNFNLLL